jgi:hypothetical protein
MPAGRVPIASVGSALVAIAALLLNIYSVSAERCTGKRIAALRCCDRGVLKAFKALLRGRIRRIGVSDICRAGRPFTDGRDALRGKPRPKKYACTAA